MDGSSLMLDRRRVLLLAGVGVLSLGTFMRGAGVRAEALSHAVVYRDPTCGCCHKWVEHLEAHGFNTSVRDMPSMRSVKARFGVPPGLASCHTAEIGGYVIEGHVPAGAIKRLLQEKPEARGLAVPGMPIGSPGMEGPNPEVYDVLLFGDGEPLSFGRYLEDRPV